MKYQFHFLSYVDAVLVFYEQMFFEIFVVKSLWFVIEAEFISEQITQCRIGALLEISDTFSSKLNIFSDIILQRWLN